MPTRRKALSGGVAALALIGGVALYGGEDSSESEEPDDDRGDGEQESQPESKPESKPEPEPTPEPKPTEGSARFETTVDVPEGNQRVSRTAEFGLHVENRGDAPGEYGVRVELDRVDPDTDHGEVWVRSGALEPGDVETHVVEHYYRASGTYELRVDGEVVEKFDVLASGRSRSTGTNDGGDGSEDDPEVTVGGDGTVDATEESPEEYDS